VSRAGTSIGTRRRTLVERGQLEQAARANVPGFRSWPRKLQQRRIAELHGRVGRG
jgi:hypothetical protein